MQESDKHRLRSALRRKRENLPADAVREDSARIVARLLDMERVFMARSAMLYLPAKGEVDTWPLLEHFWARGGEVLLPRCRRGQPGVMDAIAVASRADLEPGRFGLTEPRADLPRRTPAPAPEIVLVPALAFDRDGNRLGFGGGYYDRFLPTLAGGPWLVGLAYAFQLLDSVPVEPWDCPVHAVVTPEEIIHVNTGNPT